MKTRTLVLASAILVLGSNSFAMAFKGRVYDQESKSDQPLYKFERNERTEGNQRIVEGKFFTNDGKLALREKLHYSPGKIGFDVYEFERPLSEEKAVVKKENNKLVFSYDEGKDHTNNKESLEENTINRDELMGFVSANWPKLIAGEKLKSRFILPDRAETIGFGLKYKEETNYKGKPAVLVVMSALSPFVAAVAGDTFLVFEKGGQHRLLEVTGRAPVLKLTDGKWKSLKSRIEFDYES